MKRWFILLSLALIAANEPINIDTKSHAVRPPSPSTVAPADFDFTGRTTLGIVGAPGGSTTQVQYNNAGVLAGDPGMTWDNVNKVLSLTSPNQNRLILTNTGGTGQRANWIIFNKNATGLWFLGSDISNNGGDNFFLYDQLDNNTDLFVDGANNLIALSSIEAFGWSSAGTGLAPLTIDTGLRRNAAGVVEIDNGVAGTFADLKLRNLTLSGTCTGCGGATGANPTALVGLTSVNGSAGTFLRSDGAPPIDQSIAPTWTGLHKNTITDTNHNVAYPVTLTHNDTGVSTTSTGIGIPFYLSDTAGIVQESGAIDNEYLNPANGTRNAYFRIQTVGSDALGTTAFFTGTHGLSVGSLAVATTADGVVDAKTGFLVNSTAGSSGIILQSNGTNIVKSAFTLAAPGTSGNVLKSDGINWTSAAPSGGVPAGANTNIQYNDSGAFGGDANLTWNKTTFALNITGNQASPSLATVTNTNATAANTQAGFSGANGTHVTTFGILGTANNVAAPWGPDEGFLFNTGAGGLMIFSSGSPIKFVSVGTSEVARIISNSINECNACYHGWVPGLDLSAAADTALIRNAAGIVEVDNGTAGQYRELRARSVQHNAVTVATLPASPTIGQVAAVTDGTAALAWGATVTGGASTPYLVWYNGTAWTVIGK